MQCSGSAQVCRPHGYGGFYLCSLVSALLCSTGDHPLEKRGHRQKKHVPAGHHSLAEIREPLRESAGASEGEGGQQLGWSPSPSEGPPMEPGSEGGGPRWPPSQRYRRHCSGSFQFLCNSSCFKRDQRNQILPPHSTSLSTGSGTQPDVSRSPSGVSWYGGQPCGNS